VDISVYYYCPCMICMIKEVAKISNTTKMIYSIAVASYSDQLSRRIHHPD